MGTEIIDKLFLELSQVTQATTAKELELKSKLDLLLRLIDDDAYAVTFQTMGQYRTALLKALAARPGGSDGHG